MTKRLLLLLTFLQVVLGGGKLWADTFTWDLSANTGKATYASNGTITVAFGGTGLSAQKNYMGFKRNNTMSVSCSSSGYTITSILLTFASGYAPSSNQFTSDPTGLNETCTVWSGSGSSSIVISNPGGDTRITNVTVTYSSTSAAEYSYNIPIEDLRFEHQTYDPFRTGVLGLNITTSGWQSYTNTSTTPYNYTLLLSTAGKTSNYIRVTAGSAILTKVVLVGADGAGTFHKCSSLGTDNYPTTDEDQIVWMKDGGAKDATISFTADDQPQVSAIYVFTKSPLSITKQDVTLRFDPASGTADANITDFQIAGRVKATIGISEIDNGNFRPDDFTASSVSNSGSEASFNQFHISTGQVGVNTGSTAGTATVTAAFSGNQFYNAVTPGTCTYTLTVNAATAMKTKTISINDMRISKTASTAGLNASGNGLDRTLGGFAFVFGGAEGVKFNNGDHIILRNQGSGNEGTITITPQVSTGSVTINKVVVNMISGYTDGTVTATKPAGDISLSGKSSYTFDNVNASSDNVNASPFTLTSVSGNVYIQSFTIYYTESEAGALNDALITPTITFSEISDAITPGKSYSSPTIETSPKNFDIGLVSSNASVATVKTSGWTTAPLVALAGETGTATITASAAASTYYKAAAATYTVTYTDASAEKWDFRTLNVSNTINADDWTAASGGDYYNNKFTTSVPFNVDNPETYATTNHTTSQIHGLLFGRDNSDGLSAEQIRLYSSYMYFKNSAVIIAVPVSANDKVLVTFDGGSGTTQAGFDIGNAQVEGDASATSINSDDTQKTVTLVAQANGYVTLKVNRSKVKLYRIQKSTETRGTLDLRDTSNSYERYVGTGTTASTDNHFSHRVKFTPSDGAATPVTYADDASKFHITSSDNSILDASGAYVVESSFGTSSSFYFANIIPKAAGTATLTITFDGNDRYKPNSYVSQTYTVYGPGEFQVQADNQNIQQGQFSVVNPVITDKDGNALGIRLRDDGSGLYTTYVLGEDDDTPDYNDYFDFTYEAGTGSGDNYTNILVDATGKITTEQGTPAVAAAVGATRQITVTARPKSQYASAFTTDTAPVSATATITIIEKTPEVQLEFYWDADCTDEHKVKDTEYTTVDKLRIFDSGIFAGGFPNGRMLYVKAKNLGDSIWFSYNQNADAATIPAHPSLDKKKRIFEYRYGVPIYVDDDFVSGTSYVTLNIVATSWDAATQTRNLNGSVARFKFPLVTHERPAQPTYDPVSPDAIASLNKDGRKIMNTAQNVVAYGEGASKGVEGVNNMVFGKFSTSTVYTTEQLVNEKTVTYRLDNVPVVSTEVAKRRFTSVQIRKVTSEDTYNYGEYISEQTYTEYWYLYDTDLRITPSVYNIDVNTAIPIGSAPAYTVTWYNKKTGKNQEVDSYDGKITYVIAGQNGAADATLDTSTGIVTSGSKQGWVRVKVTYTGGEQHGGVSGEPQYTSTTDKSEAFYYVYIFDTSKERPTITPPTRNFTGKMNFTITAPANWTTYYTYTTNGSEPDDPTSSSASIAAATNKTFEIGEVATADGKIPLAVGSVLRVKAIAIKPGDAPLYSAVVSESYTRKAPLPDPVFDPDGVGTPYRYNTSTLTVQIACAYAGSVIYYTVDGTDPVIGNSNTYRYSGLSKVVISGNVGIKAVAYDPVQEIYSNVVLSSYQYSDKMSKPYFQISNDGGQTWYGYGTEDSNSWEQNGTKWYNNQAHAVKPTTQIRIIDPNPVTGTIFYTVDGSTPADNSTTMIYAEGYPFTVAKTTTGRAITILEDASSDVSTAEFTINTETYGNVWEAVNETLTESDNKKGIHKDDGFVISTDENLSVANTGSKVNLKSIASSPTGQGKASKTYAQKYITATFGGYELASWEQMTIADAAIGAPIDGIAQYNIKNSNDTGIGNGNAKDENLENYNHIYSYKTEADKKNTGSVTAATTHEKTFRLPATGGFVRFEPETDGDLTIWCLQQGALLYEDDKYFIPNVLRIRPVYMVDEQGNSLKVKTVNGVPQLWSSARLSENWATIHATAASNSWKNSRFIGPKSDDYDTEGEDYVQYVRVSDGAIYNTVTADDNHIIITKLSAIPDGADKTKYYKKLVNKGPNRTETAAIYQLYKADLDKNHVNIGDPIKPFAIHTGTTISMNDEQLVDDSDDGTGYVLASGGYAKYTFEVKAGKSYYFFAQGSKIGIRGFQFVSTESGTRPEVSLDADGTGFKVGETTYSPADLKTAFADTPVNVTIKRTIKKDQWSTLVLPFSVSATQLEKLFGDGTGTRAGAPEVEHYKDIVSPNTVVFKRHKYQMIVAGTPILIWSEKDVTDPKFEGVQIEADVVETMTGLTSDEYSFIGNFVKTDGAMHQYDYYFGKNDGKLYRYTGANNIAVNGSIAWLRPKEPSASRMLSLAFTSVEEDLDSDSASTTGIIEIVNNDLFNEYNGQKAGNGVVYNLKGMKVSDGSLENLPKGVYIVNGKKVVVE